MIENRSFTELRGSELYALLRLRSDIFVVEQQCVYSDMDGRDTEPDTRHIFCLSEPLQKQPSDSCLPEVSAYLRLLKNGNSQAIGRVVTASSKRSSGLASRLIQYALQHLSGPCTLNAQTHLEAWYGRFGFVRNGEDFDEDGILHLPMRREAPTLGSLL